MSTFVLLLIVSLSIIGKIGAFVPSAQFSTNSRSGLMTTEAAKGFVAVRKMPFNSRQTTTISLYMSTKTEKELACITNVSDDKYDALSEYIVQWSKLLQADPKGSGLTTPVTVATSDVSPSGDMAKVSGVKIVFIKTRTGDAYKSKEEERAMEEGEDAEEQEKNAKEGGVEVLVEQLHDGRVQVRARRTETDEDTTVKEMSEETIIKELKIAMDVFNKDK